jgi:Xaa-Pro aminopeptidase
MLHGRVSPRPVEPGDLSVLAIPGFGGVRHEDVYRVTRTSGEILSPIR